MKADIGYADRAPGENARNSSEILELAMISFVLQYRNINTYPGKDTIGTG
jgi:hypothetical protein